MKIPLDECVDRRFARDLAVHEVRTVPQMGWASLKNGVLLRLADASGFDAFITVDQNVSAQQNLKGLPVAIVVLRPRFYPSCRFAVASAEIVGRAGSAAGKSRYDCRGLR